MATSDIGNIILSEAAKVPGNTWTKIKQASKLYVNGYSQSLQDIAQGIADGDITAQEGGIYVKNAANLFEMSIANMSEITLNEIQTFFNKVFGLAKAAINSKLPVPLL